MSNVMLNHVLIWDFNGTILDDREVCLTALNHMLASRGLPVQSDDDYLAHFDFPVQDYYREIGFDFSREPFTSLASEYMAMYQPASFSCNLRKGVAETLALLQRQGMRQILLSATRQDFLLKQVRHFKLEGFFSDILGLSDILGRSKLDMAVHWFGSQGFSPQRTWMIGDTQHDYHVALALRCSCVLITGGHNSRDRLLGTGAPVLESLDELAEFINHSIATW
jgi:phosphoglycolate phosphatase